MFTVGYTVSSYYSDSYCLWIVLHCVKCFVCQSRYVKVIVVGLYVCLIEIVHVGGLSLPLLGVTVLKYTW